MMRINLNDLDNISYTLYCIKNEKEKEEGTTMAVR